MTLIEPILLISLVSGVSAVGSHLSGFTAGWVVLLSCVGTALWMWLMQVTLGTAPSWIRTLAGGTQLLYLIAWYILAIAHSETELHGLSWVWVPLEVAGLFVLGWFSILVVTAMAGLLFVGLLYGVRRLQGKPGLFAVPLNRRHPRF